MLKEMTDVWSCDACPKEETTHDGEMPVNWYEVSLIRIPKELAGSVLSQLDPGKFIVDTWDICSEECLVRAVDEAGKLISKSDPSMVYMITVAKYVPEPEEPKSTESQEKDKEPEQQSEDSVEKTAQSS